MMTQKEWNRYNRAFLFYLLECVRSYRLSGNGEGAAECAREFRDLFPKRNSGKPEGIK